MYAQGEFLLGSEPAVRTQLCYKHFDSKWEQVFSEDQSNEVFVLN